MIRLSLEGCSKAVAKRHVLSGVEMLAIRVKSDD
jgi:hypothetical protein